MRMKMVGVWKTKQKKSSETLEDTLSARKTNGKYRKEKC